MAKAPDKSMSLLTALASAAATAYALAYMAHAEWGLSRIVVREDAMGMAGLLAVTIIARIVFRRKKRDHDRHASRVRSANSLNRPD
jgi:hypothetical protein